jgi:hypothetical protein
MKDEMTNAERQAEMHCIDDPGLRGHINSSECSMYIGKDSSTLQRKATLSEHQLAC